MGFGYPREMSETELKNYFQISNLILRTNHKEYGPFGNLRHAPHTDERIVYNIPIERGDVLAQVTDSFIYPGASLSGDGIEPIGFKSIECFGFYVSNT